VPDRSFHLAVFSEYHYLSYPDQYVMIKRDSVNPRPLSPPAGDLGGGIQKTNGDQEMANSINMLLDVNVGISVQLGQTRMTIRELLNLRQGSLVRLNRMAGEPVDVFIKDQIMAKGEITVVDDKLSVRIGQLYGAKEKFKHL